ncbi:unnamed protein product, partial [Timema podura]|nr:unnamed protein product [Timema podura]
ESEALASEATISRPRAHVMDDIKKYRLRFIGLANTYKDVLQEVDVQGKSMERVVEDCVLLIRLMKHCGAPSLPRIVLLGPRGAGKRTQAKLLRDRFNLVHIEFDEVLRQALQEQSELGNILRSRAPSMNLESEHIEKILENRLLSWDCLARGWVLTEFPKNEKEFKILDLVDTPPNRDSTPIFKDIEYQEPFQEACAVILRQGTGLSQSSQAFGYHGGSHKRPLFYDRQGAPRQTNDLAFIEVIVLDVHPEECVSRVSGRRINVFTGSEHHLLSNPPEGPSVQEVAVHPRDKQDVVHNEDGLNELG